MKNVGIAVIALLIGILALPGCFTTPAVEQEDLVVATYNDPGKQNIEAELATLPIKHPMWDLQLDYKNIQRVTLVSDQLYVECYWNQRHILVAINRFTGLVQWEHRLTETGKPLTYRPVVAHGIPEKIQELQSEIFALQDEYNTEKGKADRDLEKLTHLLKQIDSKQNGLAVARQQDNVFFISDNVLYGLGRLDGNLLWRKHLPTINIAPSSPPYAVASHVFIPDIQLNRVFAVSVEYPHDRIGEYEAFDNIVARPFSDGNSLFFTSKDGNIYCFNVVSENPVWNYPTERPIVTRPEMGTRIVQRNEGQATPQKTVYVGSMDYALYAVDADTGNLRWKYETGNRITAPAQWVDTTTYIQVEGTGLLALESYPEHEGGNFADNTVRKGRLRWILPNGHRFLVKGEKFHYVLGPGESGGVDLYEVDEESGKVFNRVPIRELDLHLMPTNTMDDWLYAVDGAGYVFARRVDKKPWE